VDIDQQFIIRDVAEVTGLYEPALERSVRKQLDHLDAYCREFIAASPIVVVGTQADGAADNSPRGDMPGFVKVVDDHTLLIPDRRGNNRLDTLQNIIRNPPIGLVFLIPGVHETFRVNGEAIVSRDPALTGQFEVEGKRPRTVIVVNVKEAYIHCSRALVRADLWNPAKHVERSKVPSMGAFLAKHTGGFVEAQAVDDEIRERVPVTLY
jgi:PPOX class probable FMN-dependent enzyme